MATSFQMLARYPQIGPKEGSQNLVEKQVGFCPFRGSDASLTLDGIVA
jgi:hypothetical protein